MKTKTITFCSLCFCAALFAADAPIDFKKRDPNAGPTVITSDRLEFDYNEFIALFDGKVKVIDPQFTLAADKMLIFFENTNDVKRVDAIGSVVLTNGNMTAICGKATYTAKNGQVQLNSPNGEPPPVVTKDETRISGAVMSVWLNEQRVTVDKDVVMEIHAVSSPKKQ